LDPAKFLDVAVPPTGLPLPAGEASAAASGAYWDGIVAKWAPGAEEQAWRIVSDSVNGKLLARWLPARPGGTVLKTDLFDELVGVGLVPNLFERFDEATGIDVSPAVVAAASGRYPRLHAEIADVRALPFPAETFDAVVSNSTLDHFALSSDIDAALRELYRVLRPRGTLIVTLDNPCNPVVAIRNALPERLRTASRLVPYTVGATCGPGRLRSLLEQTGFEVAARTAVFHCPRAVVVLGGRLVYRHCSPAGKRRYVRAFTAFEGLGKLPTRYLTGYFVAALAKKP
jgi:SAM-dependent methyltransferase